MAATGTPTPNIGLRRAQGTDPASVDDINYNSAIIDTKLGAVGNSSVQDQIDTLNSKITALPNTYQIVSVTTDSNGNGVLTGISAVTNRILSIYCPNNADLAVTPFSLRNLNVATWMVNIRNVSTWAVQANQTIDVLVYYIPQ